MKEERKKLLTPYIWVKPHDAPLFVPATPGSVLQGRDLEVADKILGRMGMKLKVIETAGRKLGSVLVNLDLTGCWWDHCFLCECEARDGPKGGSHTRSGVTYTATCLECGWKDVKDLRSQISVCSFLKTIFRTPNH